MNEEEERRLQTLMADLESSIATFDQRFAEADAPPVDNGMNRKIAKSSLAEQETAVRIPVAQLAAPHLPTPHKAESLPPDDGAAPALTPLLAELAVAAREKAGCVREENDRRHRIATELGRALRRLADYLHQMTTHLDTLRPSIPMHFAIDRRTHFSNVHWQEGSTRGETDGRSERSPMHKLTLRIRYSADPLSLVVPERTLRHFEHELYLMNLAWRDAGIVETAGHGLGRRVEVEGSIPLQLVFVADIDQERLVVRSRNLIGLGLAAYAIEPSGVDTAALDALARCLLGQSRRLPAAFRPIPFNTPDSKA